MERQISVRGFLERGAKRRDQRMRQPIDELRDRATELKALAAENGLSI